MSSFFGKYCIFLENMVKLTKKREIMKDTEIEQLFGIPNRTLSNWKKSNDWRAKLYTYISLKTTEELKPELDRIVKILAARKDK